MLLSHVPKRKNLISLTPLIDVVFILLLFFMISSHFNQYRSVELNTVAAGTSAAQQNWKLLLITPESVELNGKLMAMRDSELTTTLQRIAAQEQSLTIAALHSVPLQHLVSLLDFCQTLGVEKLRIAESVTR